MSNQNIPIALLIDGHSMLYRAFFAAKSKNENNADLLKQDALSVFKFTIQKLVNEQEYKYKIISFDVSRKTFRREKFAEYKKQRVEMPQELKELRPHVVKLLEKMNITVLDAPEFFESDDVIATLSKQFAECEIRSVVCTTDKDLLQLVNYFTSVNLIKNNSVIISNNYENFSQLNDGLFPCQIPFIKALSGDSSDNYKGIPGIGEKTAISLVTKYKNKRNMFNCLDEIPEKIRTKIIKHEKELDLYLEIATVVKNLKLNFSINKAVLD